MQADYVNPIFKAANDVFNSMLQLEVSRGDLETNDNLVSTKEANISIGVTGDLNGSILFSFPEDMVLDIVEGMSGMEMKEIDTFVTSAMGELANIICGNALTTLNENNYNCDIVPPQVLIGKGQTVAMSTEQVLTINLETDIGEFDLNISIS
ncbi:chemotaxis protein CheX [Fuchsiella alkaliacetigena]|uniref:chemotaxis protein CheX n=1 Tax=Fuchsiella alkaliacetigena TaxID=957042 RepID=UPI00200AA41E|nr:chemotaxis protein CheX [Fuchsiella alkaliacetigena]MCK8824976.1 chemotaxis protein CheX [Fuchsiella alkaliacetigena]